MLERQKREKKKRKQKRKKEKLEKKKKAGEGKRDLPELLLSKSSARSQPCTVHDAFLPLLVTGKRS